jgi:hypothetical protein
VLGGLLLRGRLCRRENRYDDAALGLGVKFDVTVDQGEQSMVSAQADVCAWMPFRATLARDYVAGNHLFAAEDLQA